MSNCKKSDMLLYAVTDSAWTGKATLLQQVEAALKGGVTCVQLREKQLNGSALLEQAKEMASLCRYWHVPFIINDNVQLALACGADGVHVGQSDTPAAFARRMLGAGKIVGVSAHNVAEAEKAVADGADYLGCGAMFATSTKTNVTALPMATLSEICSAVDIPVVAIGGINKSNILALRGSGADGVALVSAIFAADDIEAECRQLKTLAEQIIRK